MGLYRISLLACVLSCQLILANDRECVTSEAEGLTHVREVKSNDSPEIRTILKHSGIKNAAPYCSATVKFVFGPVQCGQ